MRRQSLMRLTGVCAIVLLAGLVLLDNYRWRYVAKTRQATIDRYHDDTRKTVPVEQVVICGENVCRNAGFELVDRDDWRSRRDAFEIVENVGRDESNGLVAQRSQATGKSSIGQRIEMAVPPSMLYVSAWVKTTGLTQGTHLYVECTKRGPPKGGWPIGQYGVHTSARSKVLRGTVPWTKLEFALPVHVDADVVNISLHVYGSEGEAVWDDVEVRPAYRKIVLGGG